MALMPKQNPALVKSRREAATARALVAFQAAVMRDPTTATLYTQKGLQVDSYALMDGAVGEVALTDDAVTAAKIATAAVLADALGVTAGTVTNQRALVPDGSGNINTLGITGAATLASAASATATIAGGASAVATIGGGSSAVINLAGGLSAQLGVFGATAAGQQTVTGLKGGNAALGSLLTALATYGIIVDSSGA